MDCMLAHPLCSGGETRKHLGVPEVIKTDCGFVVDEMCSLTILLYSLAYPCTLKHVRLVFGLLSPSCISETSNFMLHSKWGFLLKLDINRIVHLLPAWVCRSRSCFRCSDDSRVGLR